MTARHYFDLDQGSEAWLAARCGLLTASEMKLILSPTLKATNNDKTRAHLYELLAQRITRYVEPHYISDDMLRGQEDEIEARALYAERFAPVTECGFITNDAWGFTLGYSPDGLVGTDGLIECKSRRQKYQVQTLIEHAEEETIPDEYALQIQTGLLVTGRTWCDFVSYSGGLPMVVIRVFPDAAIQEAILNAAAAFERQIAEKLQRFQAVMLSEARLVPTQRRQQMEITI